MLGYWHDGVMRRGLGTGLTWIIVLDRNLGNDGPIGVGVAVAGVVGNAGSCESLTEVACEGVPGIVFLRSAGEEQFELDAKADDRSSARTHSSECKYW